MSTITAAILIIGNEIISGSTQDVNVAHIAKRLSDRGIKLCEVRFVRDEEDMIAEALNAVRKRYTYVFTTGGIGPTHDDITAESVAKAFGVPCPINEEARSHMAQKYAERGVEMNEGRLRMARIPKGGELIHCTATIAPGFKIGNVFVLAGVPSIMQSQFETVENELKSGPPMLSRTVKCVQKEGDIAMELEAIQKKYPDLDIGSYPYLGKPPSLSLVLRGTDATRLDAAASDVAAMIKAKGDEPVLA